MLAHLAASPSTEVLRLRVVVRGAVQGVGFRPFVYRLAQELDLAGRVSNDGAGLHIEAEGPRDRLEALLAELASHPPPAARVESVETLPLPPRGEAGFIIIESEAGGAKSVAILADLATCPACVAEIFDPGARRFRYPFTNCTECGPRFSIVLDLPYDRPATTMCGFPLCPDCEREYCDPTDRRFHAQPIACPRCGPQLSLLDARGQPLAMGEEALAATATAIRAGKIVAAKGLAGFHLLADAGNEATIAELRRRKGRPTKPFALLVRDLRSARALADLEPAEEALLVSREAPIVLVRRQEGYPGAVAPSVAPGNPTLGLMLAATPLHHLLAAELTRPLVATSGNLSEEPIATDNAEAVARLAGIADLFLVHDRPIARHADDSVAWVIAGEARLLRRARGHAPLPVLARRGLPPLLAVGGQLKNTVALSLGRQVFLSQHLGDLDSAATAEVFEHTVADLLRLWDAHPLALAHDLHPDYHTTRWAEAVIQAGEPRFAALTGLPLVPVQHHHAHLASCLADNDAPGPALGLIWDGTGFGTDGTVWGGEVLFGDACGYERLAALRPFALPGGEAAIREPRRTAFALLRNLLGDEAAERAELAPVASLRPAERRLLARMLERGVNSPTTSSMGRLFDGVASLLGLCHCASFEGEAAMALEFAADPAERGAYELPLTEGDGGPSRFLDHRPLLVSLLADLAAGVSRGAIAARFHNALAAAAVTVARALGAERVALSGGCFQNRRLVERTRAALAAAGFEVLLHRRVPPGDGGLALGQIAVAAARLTNG